MVATSGRSLWILDDLSAVRAWSAENAAKPLHLYPARPARRYQLLNGWSAEAVGENPPRGAVVHYSLASKAAGEVTLEIFDGEGRRVRKLSSVAKPQLFPEDDPDEPMKAPEAELSAGGGSPSRGVGPALGGCPAARERQSRPRRSDRRTARRPRAPTGCASLRTVATEETTLTVLPDLRSQVRAADLEAQLAFALDLRARLDRVVADVGELREIQAQTGDLAKRLAGDGRAGDLIAAAKRAGEAAAALEGPLSQSESGDRLRHPRAARRDAAAFEPDLSLHLRDLGRRRAEPGVERGRRRARVAARGARRAAA